MVHAAGLVMQRVSTATVGLKKALETVDLNKALENNCVQQSMCSCAHLVAQYALGLRPVVAH